MSQIVRVNSRKLDGSIHRSWTASLIYKSLDLVILYGEFAEAVSHSKLGIIERGTISIEYFWREKWFNVFRFHHPDGGLRNFYCNLNTPPTFTGETVDYIDLEIDILVNPGYSCEILDLDEFAALVKKYSVSDNFKSRIEQTVSYLLNEISRRNFPFNLPWTELK